MATTRYRLRSTTTAPAVTPAFQTYTHTQSSRRQLLTSDSSALTTSAYTPDASDDSDPGDAHHIQFVSDPLAAGIVYSAGNAVALAIQGLEAHANNNLFVQLFVSVVNSSGTQQAVLRSKVSHATELGTSLSSFLLSSTLSGSYTTSLNDRLVVEISVEGDPGGGGGVQGHNASLRWGANGAGGDITGDGQTGTTLNPWFEITDTEAQNYDETGNGLTIAATVGGSDGFTATDPYSVVLVEGDSITSPDDASWDITGDIDIRVTARVSMNGTFETLAARGTFFAAGGSWCLSKYGTNETQLRWDWRVPADDTYIEQLSDTGLVSSTRPHYRVTMDVDNGSSQRVITFYYSDQARDTAPGSITWTQHSQHTVAGTTGIFAGTAGLTLGSLPGVGEALEGYLHYFELRNGIGGTVVANVDFRTSAMADSETQFTDDQGRVFTLQGNALWTGVLSNNYDETGNGVTINATLGGTDSRAAAESGGGLTITATLGGTDSRASTETGGGVTITTTLGGSDLLAFTETGQGLTITTTLGGSDVQAMVESGGLTITTTVGGSDVHEGGQQNYDETGGGLTITTTVGGMETLALTEQGGLTITTTLGGADSVGIIEQGGLIIIATPGGADSAGRVEIGQGVTIVATLGGTDTSAMQSVGGGLSAVMIVGGFDDLSGPPGPPSESPWGTPRSERTTARRPRSRQPGQ